MSQAASAGEDQQNWDSEIDLTEVLLGLYEERLVIIALTLVTCILSVVYAYLIATPVYKTTAIARPPATASILAINESLMAINSASEGALAASLTPGDAFNRVIFEARARETKRLAFDAVRDQIYPVADTDGAQADNLFSTRFLPNLQITVDGVANEDEVSELSLESEFVNATAEHAALVADSVIEIARSRAKSVLMDDINSALDTVISRMQRQLKQEETLAATNDIDSVARLEEADLLKRLQLEDQIDALRAKAQALRADRITQLKEALSIAESLGLEVPQTFEVTARQRSTQGDRDGASSVSVTSLAFGEEYLKGTKLLQAELGALQDRASDDPFIPEIRELEAELALLSSNRRVQLLQARENRLPFVKGVEDIRAEISLLNDRRAQDFSNVSLAQLDQAAIVPTTPWKPRRSLIVGMGTLMGLTLGLGVALLLQAIKSHNRRRSAS